MNRTDAPIKFWSYSALKRFETCPYELYLDRVEQAPKPVPPDDNPLVRGDRIHKAAEKFVTGEGPFVKELSKFTAEFEHLKERYDAGAVHVEESWWFDQHWGPTEWEAENKWCIVKLDVAERETPTHMSVIDWKTGKSWGKEVAHGQQMQLYAIATFMRYPELNSVTVNLGYLDEKPPYKSKSYLRTQIVELADRFAARGTKLVSATTFPPKPNKSNCRYCAFGPNNGGTGACPYGVQL